MASLYMLGVQHYSVQTVLDFKNLNFLQTLHIFCKVTVSPENG